MANLLKLTAPLGPGFAAQASTPDAATKAALDAMASGDVRGLVFPTSGTDERYCAIGAAEAYIQDALFPQVEYQFPDVAGVPAATPTDTEPALDWTAVTEPLGARSNVADQVDAYDGANPDFWLIACVKIGTQDANNHAFLGAGNGPGFGTALVKPANSGTMQFRFNSGSGLSIQAATDNAAAHVYSVRYDATTGSCRAAVDGVQQYDHDVGAIYPTAQMQGGPIYFGGSGSGASGYQLDAAGSLFHCGAIGNGTLTDAQHADIVNWMMGVYGI